MRHGHQRAAQGSHVALVLSYLHANLFPVKRLGNGVQPADPQSSSLTDCFDRQSSIEDSVEVGHVNHTRTTRGPCDL